MTGSPEQSDLYAREVEGPFASFCGGGTDNDGTMESCISIAELKGGGYALRGTKPEDTGKELRFSAAEIVDFVKGAATDPRFQN